MKIIVVGMTLAFLATVLVSSLPSTAGAAMKGTMTGKDATYGSGKKAQCPAGSCSRAGTSWAQDVRYCSPANCKKK